MPVDSKVVRLSSVRILRPLWVGALLLCWGVVGALPAQVSPSSQAQGEVVVYVSHDQEHSSSILEEFQRVSGIKVLAKYDTEDTKTVALTSEIIAAAARPVCDVFWNNECGQTERLKALDLLQPYSSPQAATIPDRFKDKDGYWTGFGARARVLMWNTDLVENEAKCPRTLSDLAQPAYEGQVAMARPRTGTTLTHVGALYAVLGQKKATDWLKAMQANRVRWESGNGPVSRSVADGTIPFGLTDTDDFNGRRLEGAPVKSLLLDQEEGGLGTLVIPNSVMILKGAPHLEAAKALVDYLLSPEVEARLAAGRAAQMPLHPDVEVPDHVTPVGEIKSMDVDFARVGTMIENHMNEIEGLFSNVTGDGSKEGSDNWMSLILAVVALAAAGVFIFAALRGGRGKSG